MAKQLYHVGCGKPLFTAEQLQQGTLALACSCGADSPIVAPDLKESPPARVSIPGSLYRLLGSVVANQGAPPAAIPHLEYYLGFTNFECAAKTYWRDFLTSVGSVSMALCDEERCRTSYAHHRLRLLKKVK